MLRYLINLAIRLEIWWTCCRSKRQMIKVLKRQGMSKEQIKFHAEGLEKVLHEWATTIMFRDKVP